MSLKTFRKLGSMESGEPTFLRQNIDYLSHKTMAQDSI